MKGDEFTIEVLGVPKAMPRPRHSVVMGKDGKPIMKDGRPITTTYSAPKGHPAVQFKSDIREAAKNQEIPYYEGAIELSWRMYLPRPKALCRKKDPDGPLPHTKRPDRDNLDKSVMDALTGVAWKDDTQVFRGTISKWYHAKPDADPGTHVVRPCAIITIKHL